MKKTLIIQLLALLPLSLFASDSIVAKINAIKKCSDYLYAEATMKTQQEAEALAFEMLLSEVDNWANSDNCAQKRSFSKNEIRNLADTIVAQRANMIRVFAYIAKQKLTPDVKKEVVKKRPPVKRPNMLNKDIMQLIQKKLVPPPADNVVESIRRAKDFFELKEILPKLKERGLISDFGKYATATEPEKCQLIVYDIAGNIRAFLDKGNEERMNLLTGKPDNINNYRGCGAIWIK